MTKPVLVLQHMTDDGPAHFGRWLAGRGIPMDVRNTEAGQTFPERIDGYAGLAILGGEMSANDALPSLRRAEDLIRQALAAGVPTIGHCLGGQLMARALGAAVHASPQPEIGWFDIDVADTALARAWFGDEREPTVFQWHNEAFELPQGAQLLATSAACPHQAFAIGPHLAMQFHIELDAAKLARWLPNLTAEQGAAITARTASVLGPAQALAERLYARWFSTAG